MARKKPRKERGVRLSTCKDLALPLSFALGVVLIVAGTQAGPPLTSVLYLKAILARVGVAYFLRGESGHGDKVAKRSGGKRPCYEAVEHTRHPESEDTTDFIIILRDPYYAPP